MGRRGDGQIGIQLLLGPLGQQLSHHLSSAVQAAITTYHRLGELNKIYVSQFWRLTSPDPVSGKSLPTGLQMDISYPHMAAIRERARSPESLLLRTPIPPCGFHPHDLLTPRRSHLPIPTITLGRQHTRPYPAPSQYPFLDLSKASLSFSTQSAWPVA